MTPTSNTSSSSRSSSMTDSSKTSYSSSDDFFPQELTEKLQYVMRQGEGVEFCDSNYQSMKFNDYTFTSNNEMSTFNYQLAQHETLGSCSSNQKLCPPPPLDIDILSKTSPDDQILSPAEFDAIFASFSAIAGEPDDYEFDSFPPTLTDAPSEDEKLSKALDSISIQ
ncbi:736_t:CDS:1 [Dentiscutata heterogama]|uniref:736_t:CDS:1 n=1 Tax=Dentiscutata heterogama TaxID=1316150 RepID=A0ACA9MB82_9GLOM|nr:736_t:CDS:1 [Dentiscutata heterogama]